MCSNHFSTLLHDADTFSALLLSTVNFAHQSKTMNGTYQFAINTTLPKTPIEDHKIDRGHKSADTWVKKPTHLLGGAGIHTLLIMASGGCQLVMVMVPHFTTNQVVFYPSEPPFHRLESQEHHTIHYDHITHSLAMCN